MRVSPEPVTVFNSRETTTNHHPPKNAALKLSVGLRCFPACKSRLNPFQDAILMNRFDPPTTDSVILLAAKRGVEIRKENGNGAEICGTGKERRFAKDG